MSFPCKRSVLLLLALAAPLAQAQAPSTPDAASAQAEPAFLGGFLKETRVIYPLRIGDWQAQGEHLYEQQELGASVRYMHNRDKDRWMDLYFYPSGILTDEQLAEAMENTLEGLRLSAGYSAADIDPVKPIVFAQGRGAQKQKITAYTTSMRLMREGQTYHSAMVMLVSDLYFIKGRFSVEEKSLSRRETQKQLEKFVAAAVRESTLHSTGDCWAPLPLVEKAVLTEGEPGQLASTSKDGTLSAVAYADRIEVLDAKSSEAAVMQFLSLPIIGRLVPGCGPAEDMNPVVPKGMREIRLEFGAPSGDKGNQSVPLRTRATGVS
ncbi:MAG TPA: hypothetical protein VF471_11315 [Pseudoxanthomonas sp.]